jgi:hypothetical protein
VSLLRTVSRSPFRTTGPEERVLVFRLMHLPGSLAKGFQHRTGSECTYQVSRGMRVLDRESHPRPYQPKSGRGERTLMTDPAQPVSALSIADFAQRDQRDFVYRAFTFCGGSFQSLRLSPDLMTLRGSPTSAPQPRTGLSRKAMRFRLRDCYPLWCGVPSASTNARLCNFPTRRSVIVRRVITVAPFRTC